MYKSERTSKSIGLSALVFLIFLVLKLSEIGQVATWSWWWVTSPLWIPLAIIVIIMITIFLIAIVTAMFSK